MEDKAFCKFRKKITSLGYSYKVKRLKFVANTPSHTHKLSQHPIPESSPPTTLFWEVFMLHFGTWRWGFVHLATPALAGSGARRPMETQSSISSQRCLLGLRSGFCAGQLSSSTLKWAKHVFMDLASVHKGTRTFLHPFSLHMLPHINVLYNNVLLTFFFEEEPHMGVMAMCSQTTSHTVYIY